MTLVRLLRVGRAQDSARDTNPENGSSSPMPPFSAGSRAAGAARVGATAPRKRRAVQPDEPSADPADGARARRTRRAALAALTAVLALGGCGFLYGAHRLTSAESAQNRALTDTEATHRVAGEVANALARVFSYTPDGTAAAERSARSVLDGRAARQYQDLFDQVRDDLTEQRLTLSTRAVRTGVIELDGDRARLLVFLDQTSRRGKDEATTAAAQLTVTARLENDRWRIVDLKAR
ncbi:hypothetical protein [Streptomyces sp. NPDC018972]|uniref:hypothetical protein n=1 Tax=Streptomyces sp. NPDC018972 TaxID=3365060 RepID=UPI00378AC703